jgi:hypothetical protein
MRIGWPIAPAAHASPDNRHGMGKESRMAARSGSARQGARLATTVTQAARESVRLGAIGATLPAATAITLAHRLPLLAGLGSAPAMWQAAEIWRMTWEKPVAFWQGWLALGPWQWQLWHSWAMALAAGHHRPDLALRRTASSLGAARRAVTPGHRRVVGNARRLSRRGKPRRRA